MNNPIVDLVEACAYAEYKGFSDLYNTHWKTKEKTPCRPNKMDYEVWAMFEQTWGSTALGFDGIGGAAITPAYTIVLYCQETREFLVFFGGTFAYKVNGDSKNIEKFYSDIRNRNLVEVSRSSIYS